MSINSSVWNLSNSEYQKYTDIFKANDRQGRGILTGDQARELLSQSGLPPHILFQVWNLADSQQTGHLDPPRFAIAMHLIFKKLAGHNLPLQLPTELQPHQLPPQTKPTTVSNITTSPSLNRPTTNQSTEPTSTSNQPKLDQTITSLETELRRKRRLLSERQPSTIPDSELTSLINRIKLQHTNLPFFSEGQNLKIDSRWSPDLTRLAQLEAELPELKEIENLVQESQTILSEIQTSGRQLFALEDAQTHGYTIPPEGTQLPTISLPTSGDSAIAQKAAAMLAQRMQALQLNSSVGPIPADAQRRLEAHQSVLESQKNSSVSRVKTIADNVRSHHQAFQTQAGKYRLGRLDLDQGLEKELVRWRQPDVSTDSRIISLVSTLKGSKAGPVSTTPGLEPQSTSSHFNSPASASTLSSPSPGIPSKPLPSLMGSRSPTLKTKPPKPQRSAPTPKPSTRPPPPKPLPHGSTVFNTRSDATSNPPVETPGDDFTAIAQASRLARAKAQEFERTQSTRTETKLKPKPKPIPKRPPPTPAPTPKITSDELARQQDQQQGPSVDEIREASRRARLAAQSNMNLSSETTPPPPTPSGHARKNSVSQLVSNFTHSASQGLSESTDSVKRLPPPVKKKPGHLQSHAHKATTHSSPSWERPIPTEVPSQLQELPEISEVEVGSVEEKEPVVPQPLPSSETLEPQNESPELPQQPEVVTPQEPASEEMIPEDSTSFASNPSVIVSGEGHSDYNDGVEESEPTHLSTTDTNLESTPTPQNPWLVEALFDYQADDGLSFSAGTTVVVSELPSDAPGWCLGHVNDRTGWIPKSYLKLPESTSSETPTDRSDTLAVPSQYDDDVHSTNEGSVEENTITELSSEVYEDGVTWATLTTNFSAEVDGGDHVEFEAGQIAILDTSNPDWHLARFPHSEIVAYVPADLLSYTVDTNPFARQPQAEDQSYHYHSDTETSGVPTSSGMRKAQSDHHLPLQDYQEASSPHRQGWASQMDPAALEGMSKSDIQRLEAIHELVTTEKTYLRDMQLVVDVFYLPLELRVDREELALIFANLPELVVVNTLFLSELEAVGTEGVGAAFLNHVSEFQAYGPYCGNHAAASRYLQTDHPHVPFLKEASSRPECRMLSLASFLLQPVQRITRYPLLLKQIYKYTPPDHPEHTPLKEAIDQAEAMLEQINREAYVNENAQQLRELETRIDLTAYPDFQLVGLTRHLGPREAIMDGPLTKHRSHRSLQGFLFNDLFLLAQPKSSSSSYQFNLYRQPIPLSRLKVRDAQTSQGRRGIFSPYDDTCFQLIHAKEILTLKASTASTKKKWLAEFQKAIQIATRADSTR